MHRLLFMMAGLWLALATGAYAQKTGQQHLSVLDITSLNSTDPCIDFYAYSCGGWLRKNPIPDDQTSWSVSNKLQDDNLLILRSILEKATILSPDRSPNLQKIGDYYAACMDEAALKNAGSFPLKNTLEKIATLTSKADMAKLIAAMPYTDVLFDLHSVQDYADATQVIAEIDQDGLSLPDRDFYLLQDRNAASLRNMFLAHIQSIFRLLGDTPEVATEEAARVLRIETALANGSMDRVRRRDPHKTYDKKTRTQLKTFSPDFPWDDYLNAVGLSALESLNVADTGFLKAMNQAFKREDLESWKSYLRWHLAHSNAAYLSDEFIDADFDFYGKALLGAKEIAPRWKRCVNSVDADLGEALGQAYVEQVFSPEARQQAHRMVTQIQDAMRQEIASLPWMSSETKNHALEKLQAVANKIGYPERWRDYSDLAITREDFMGNVLRAREFEFRRQLAKIGKPVDRGEWAMTPPTVNAYYDTQLNDINLPAGILQPPLFDPGGDAAPNYGNTGSTIGHELTHGFDDEGRQFDAEGNLRNWWSAGDSKQFEKRASCLASQYSHYTAVDRIQINGKLTLGENVADLGGLILAYRAWQEEVRGKQLESMEGFSPEQRFFVGYAQSWCTNTRLETQRLEATADVHSPEQYRVNGIVSNMPEFQQAFHCKAGSPMVRKEQCRVW